jgi:uncharacterized membrane protein
MSTSLHSSRAQQQRREQIFRLVGVFLVLIIAVLAIGLPLTQHGYLRVYDYDDGAYLGAATHLFSGGGAYAGFFSTAPPGILELLWLLTSPFQSLGTQWIVAEGHVLVVIIGITNCLLIYWLLRNQGVLAAVFGGVAFALFPYASQALQILMLEPFLVFFCLLAAVAIDRKTMLSDFGAGIALGFALSTKLWAGFLIVAIFLVFVWNSRQRLLRMAIAATATTLVLWSWFLIKAPGPLFKDLISSQAERSPSGFQGTNVRMTYILGLPSSWSSGAAKWVYL